MGRQDYETETLISHALTGGGFDASEDGTGRGTPLVSAYRSSGNCGAWDTGDRIDALTTGTDPGSHLLAFSCKDSGGDAMVDLSPTLRAGAFDKSHANAGVMPAVAFQTRGSNVDVGTTSDMRPVVATSSAVRRLTPRECECLQGFPDDYTAITYRGKPAADGPRYKALGNSMAVPVVRWILSRIERASAGGRLG